MKNQNPSTGCCGPYRYCKSTGLAAALTILFFFPFFSAASGMDTAGPQIMFPENTFRAKPVEQGQDVEHTFAVLNKGREPLQIIKVKPG